MTSREEMVLRIARRLGRPEPGSGVRWDPGPPLAGLGAPPGDGVLVHRFIAELEKLGGHGVWAGEGSAALEYILGVAASGADGTVILWDDPLLDRLGIAPALRARGAGVTLWQEGADGATLRQMAATARVGITGAAWGVAETGTIVLPSGSGQGRLVSLLPPVHIAVLPERRLLPSVADLMRLLAEEAQLPSSLALATGPSRSADIEQDLSIGVHGPAEVHVVVVPA